MSDDWDEVLRNLAARRATAGQMGGADRLARQHGKGKLDVRTRVDTLFDPGTFAEIGRLAGVLPGDGVVCGTGDIGGVPSALVAEDFTVAGGSIGGVNMAKRHRVVTLAVQERMPLVVLLDGAGHRPPLPGDPVATRRPNDLQALADARHRIPMACAVLGPAAGHSALAAPMSDFTVMTPGAAIFTAGPPLVKASLGEDVDATTLGGPAVALPSGVIHNAASDDADALAQIRDWLDYLARPFLEDGDDRAPRTVAELTSIVPRSGRQPYDMRQVVDLVADRDSWFELHEAYGRSLLTGLARLGGRTVAVLANQPLHLGGSIDADAGDKGERFITFADAFGLPLVFLTDNPGVMAGTAAERSGVLTRAGRMFVAQHRATVPKLQVTLRKAYGFGSTVMAMNPFGGQTLNAAFPGVTFGAMPTRGADEATRADDDRRAAMLQAELESGYRSAAGASLDDLIEPAELRNVLLAGLRRAAARLPDKGVWT